MDVTPPFDELATDVLAAVKREAVKEKADADAALQRLEEHHYDDLSDPDFAADLDGEREGVMLSDLEYESMKSAAAAKQLVAMQALSPCCNFLARASKSALLVNFPMCAEIVSQEDAVCSNRLQSLAFIDLEGDEYRNLHPKWQRHIAAFVLDVCCCAISFQSQLWENSCSEPRFTGQEKYALMSIISAASSSIFSALVNWRDAAADLVSASSINGLGALVGSEALGCVRRKVTLSAAFVLHRAWGLMSRIL